VGCWKKLSLKPNTPMSSDWNKALKIFNARIRQRFLKPADQLIEFEKGKSRKIFGFAILTIDFLVIEMLQGFREGKINHTGESRRLFTVFLGQWNAFKECVPQNMDSKKCAELVYVGYRCALYHTGSTTVAFRVGVSGPMLDFKNDQDVKINRTCLHKRLKLEFEAYLDDLRTSQNIKLRRNFICKMDHICGVKS